MSCGDGGACGGVKLVPGGGIHCAAVMRRNSLCGFVASSSQLRWYWAHRRS